MELQREKAIKNESKARARLQRSILKGLEAVCVSLDLFFVANASRENIEHKIRKRP